MKNVLYILLGIVAGFLLAGALIFVSRAPTGAPIVLRAAPTAAPIKVHVIGAVPRPDVYDLPEGARVQDAINAAGGLLADANVDGLNLAALVVDGQQLSIPYKDGTEPIETVELPGSETATPDPGAGEKININTATLEELDSLPGIGLTTAQKVIDYRLANGPFAKIEDIMNVSGIGPTTFEGLKDLITV